MGTDNMQFHQRFRVWKRKSSERSSTFSLRFTTISGSVSVGPRLKVGVLKFSGLQKVSSSHQEVGNLPNRVYISSKCCLGLGWALRFVWIVFPNTKIVFC